jgi:hypothetical protein
MRRKAHLALCLGSLLAASAAGAQPVSVDLRTTAFAEPSSSSGLVVLTPLAGLSARPAEWLTLSAGYEADIVSGASESVKAGPITPVDVISSATSFSDVRHVGSGGFSLIRDVARLSASYSYGTEKDYRSQAITISAGAEFLQKNTQIEAAYARGFDRVCTSSFSSTLAPSARVALDSSEGCFGDADNRNVRDIDLDNAQIAWTQTWTPVLATQLVLSGSLQHGFLENPYREVVIGPAGDRALENHPDNRARAAAALRLKYFFRSLNGALTLGLRGYRDTWDVVSETVELEAERYMLPWLRLLVRGRFYNQTGALFWSNDYTGGEPVFGPRGQYWTGDRELSPLQSYLLGGRLLAAFHERGDSRPLGAFSFLSLGGGLDLLKTNLEEFTWGSADPDDTLALIVSLSISADF